MKTLLYNIVALVLLVLPIQAKPDGLAKYVLEDPFEDIDWEEELATYTMTDDEKSVYEAIEKNKIHAVKEAIEKGFDVNAWNNKDEQLIHIAARIGSIEMLELLKSHGAFLNQASEDDGLYPIHCAAKAGQLHVVKWFLENDVPVDMVIGQFAFIPYYGTPAIIAAQAGHWEVTEMLAQNGANLKEAWTDGPPNYFLNIALEQCNSEKLEWLLDQGIDPNKPGRSLRHPLEDLATVNTCENRKEMSELVIKAISLWNMDL